MTDPDIAAALAQAPRTVHVMVLGEEDEGMWVGCTCGWEGAIMSPIEGVQTAEESCVIEFDLHVETV